MIKSWPWTGGVTMTSVVELRRHSFLWGQTHGKRVVYLETSVPVASHRLQERNTTAGLRHYTISGAFHSPAGIPHDNRPSTLHHFWRVPRHDGWAWVSDDGTSSLHHFWRVPRLDGRARLSDDGTSALHHFWHVPRLGG